MISLKKYLDSAPSGTDADCWQQNDEIASVAIAAYGSALEAIGNCSIDACPGLGSELKQRLDELNRNLSSSMNCDSLQLTDRQVQEHLQALGKTNGHALPANERRSEGVADRDGPDCRIGWRPRPTLRWTDQRGYYPPHRNRQLG